MRDLPRRASGMQRARGGRSLSLSTCATLCLLPLVRGWTPPPAQLLRHRPAAAPRCLLELSEAASTCFTPDVNEDGVSEEVGIRIAPSQGKGLGAYACRHFEEGTIVGDYTGESLTARDIAARYDRSVAWNIEDHLWALSREERGVSTTGRYIYRIEEDLYIDAEDPAVSSWARFINHSREPNLIGKSLAKSYTGKPRVWFVARRAIEPGDELTWDYGDDYWNPEDEVVQ